MDKIWLKQYPAGVPAEVDVDRFSSLVALLDDSFVRHAALPAFRFRGRDIGFAQVAADSRALAAWLQAQGLQRGDRVAVMLPNLPQYPVAVAAILRAGLVVVNINPQYTPRELQYQLADSGARAIFVLENCAATLAAVQGQVPTLKVVLCATGDMLGGVRGALADFAQRHLRKAVPHFELPGATRFNDAVVRGAALQLRDSAVGPHDMAVLQYTGGTTGLSKAAVLLHRNLVANLLQAEAWNLPALRRIPAGEQPVSVSVLPLYHIFGFNSHMLMGLRRGACSILIPDPRDLAGLLKTLSQERFHHFAAVNTLFHALATHPDFDRVDWSHLVLSIGGGTAVRPVTARLWLERTGCPICEGYGLTEASPTVTCNPVDANAYSGTVGVPLPGTDIQLLDDDGAVVARGAAGEVAVRGPQVMAGYWQRPQETAQVMTADGYLRTGDIGTLDERGHLHIVDRKKDIILVSGFSVYPAEVEAVLMQMPGVLEAGAVGVADAHSGEVVKAVLVRRDATVTEAAVRSWCETHLTGYKRPRVVEFRGQLPKSQVGKVLRRELRDPPAPVAPAEPAPLAH